LKSLYLRIWLTVVAVLLLFALVAGWLFQSNVEVERGRLQSMWTERAAGWAALIENVLPHADAPVAEQREVLLDWSRRLRLPLALDDAAGTRIATSEAYARREEEGGDRPRRAVRLPLSDGRALWLLRPMPGGPRGGGLRGEGGPMGGGPPLLPGGLPALPGLAGGGVGLLVMLAVLFVAIALGAYPVVRRLTRRLEALQRGVEVFGAGQLGHRVDAGGADEVAALAASFNAAAQRIEALVASHRSLLANASHELRSPLTRMKMALSMLADAGPSERETLQREVERNIRELDDLVEEVLLASRLDVARTPDQSAASDPVALLPLAAEEGARVGASVSGDDVTVRGDERLLRRALRNLLENARRYGGSEAPEVEVRRAANQVLLCVSDRGPGVPDAERERIFEPFYRLPGHAEQAGGVGLGLSLVRQIARAHKGRVECEAREGGGSRFVLTLPE
jgi:signal transduction histidine kinase